MKRLQATLLSLCMLLSVSARADHREKHEERLEHNQSELSEKIMCWDRNGSGIYCRFLYLGWRC